MAHPAPAGVATQAGNPGATASVASFSVLNPAK
jgi:hypothetical protein